MSASATHDTTNELLPLDVLEDAAEMAARGDDWEEIAAHVRWDARDLRRAARADSRFLPLVEVVRRELLDRGEAHALRKLRELSDSEDPKVQAKAVERLAKFITAKRREETRLKVAEINRDARITVAQLNLQRAGKAARKGEAASQPEPEPAEPPMTPEQEAHWWDCERRNAQWVAEQYVRKECSIYLYGGCHKIGGVSPDATDTPVQLLGDSSLAGEGRQPVFWVIPMPPLVPDLERGPFLKPPGCRPAVCPTKPDDEPGALAG